MRSVVQNRWWPRLLFGANILFLLAAFYSYVLLRIETHLLYLMNPIIFLIDSDFFFGSFLYHPGGVVEYVSAFLSALLVYDWLGALILTVLAGLICFMTRQLLVTLTGAGGNVMPLIPAFLILLLLGQYVLVVELCLGLLVVLVSANVYFRMGGYGETVRLMAFLIVSVLVYYLVAGPYLVFVCLCIVFEMGIKRCFPISLVAVLCAATIPMSGAWLFDLNAGQTLRGLMIFYGHWLALPSSLPIAMVMWIGLMAFFPLAAVTVVLRRRRKGTATVGGGKSNNGVPAECPYAPVLAKRPTAMATQSAVLLLSVIVADLVLFDSPKKCLLQMVCSAEEREWSDALNHVDDLPAADLRRLDVRTGFHVNRALYFTGDLLDRMFDYPQTLNAPTLTLVGESISAMAQTTPRQCSEIFFELGRVNESEHMAFEAMEVFGDRPDTLKRLVYINVLTGKQEAAQRLLALLDRSLLHSEWADCCRRDLEIDAELSDVPAVASRRELMVVLDSVNDAKDEERLLTGLLERTPGNRMAFEYLMAHYLLTRQADKLAANLHRFDDFDYPHLPRHYEEALLIHMVATESQEIDLGERTIRSEAWQRRVEFAQALQRFSNDNPAEAYTALYQKFGNSYFFFYVFGKNHHPPR